MLKTPTSNLGRNGGGQHPDVRKAGGHGPTLADETTHLFPTPTSRDWKSGASNLIGTNARPLNEVTVSLLATPKASDGPHGGPNQRDTAGNHYLPGQAVRVDDVWVSTTGKDYGPGIRGWEALTGREAPCPTEPGARGNRRLSPVFVEWMMGLPAGHVTGVPDIPRAEQLRILGNGVVPQQATEAFGRLLADDWNIGEEPMDDTKIKGTCTGCKFEYVLSTKGLVRKHLSRTGPGECSGSRKAPRQEESAPPEIEALAQLHPAGTGPVDENDTEPVSRPESETRAEPLADVQLATELVMARVAETPAELIAEAAGNLGERRAEVADKIQAHRPMVTEPTPATGDMFMDPAPGTVIPDGTVNGQPDPDRDRWGRYLLHGTAHTRATTFAKLGSNTKAIEQWGHRQVVRGMTLRPDLLMLADGLDVKRDRKTLNDIVEQARDTAGQKIAANIGTAYHAFSERLDAGVMTLEQVPERYRGRLVEYMRLIEDAGLKTRREWIERTTAVTAEMVGAPVPVAGKLDRIFEMPSGDLVIGDLKTGADLSYGEAEIEVQLALYAHGVNTHGLFDWNTKQWEKLSKPVRTDFAVVIHMPAEGTGCKLIKVDIERGWREARLRGALQASQRVKGRFQALSRLDLQGPLQASGEVTVPVEHLPHVRAALAHFHTADSRARLAELYGFAQGSGKFSAEELGALQAAGVRRLEELS